MGPSAMKAETLKDCCVSRDGVIEASDSELEEIREWHIENLLKMKQVFTPEIETGIGNNQIKTCSFWKGTH